MIPIGAFSSTKYAKSVTTSLGKGYQQALLIYKNWMRFGKIPLDLMAFKNCPQLLRKIVSKTQFTLPQISQRLREGNIEKILLKLSDNAIIESVVIPMKFGWSLCVSSQVGCRMGCTFCQTGRMGLVRQLTTEEIVSQLFVARNVLGYNIRNIVFMGMGEPFDNFDAVKEAIEIFTDPHGFALGFKHITISTSGRIDGIQRMKKEIPKVNLAVSVNAPNDNMRKKLMPITRKYNMEALREALKDYSTNPTREILVEYILIKGVTDIPDAADQLAVYLKDLPVKVNLIPYNPQKPTQFEQSEPETIDLFKKRLQAYGLRTLLRTTKGSNLMAACGQLGVSDISCP